MLSPEAAVSSSSKEGEILYGVVTAAKQDDKSHEEERTFPEVEFSSFGPYSFESSAACSPSKSLTARIVSNAITHRYRAGNINALRKAERLVSNLIAFLPDTLKASKDPKRSAIYKLTDTKLAKGCFTAVTGSGIITSRVA